MALNEFLSFKDYWYAGVSAALGCAGGIAWAWRSAARIQRNKDRENKVALVQALERTRQLANDTVAAFQANQQPSYPLEVQRVGMLTDRVSDFSTAGLRGELEGLVYECSHYNAKLPVVNTAFVLSNLVPGIDPANVTPYRTMMRDHAQNIVGWADDALAHLQTDLGAKT
jgi:hypothetical protein